MPNLSSSFSESVKLCCSVITTIILKKANVTQDLFMLNKFSLSLLRDLLLFKMFFEIATSNSF